MSEYSSLIEREMELLAPPSYSLADVRRRRDRRQRNKRIGSAVTAFVIAMAALGILFKTFEWDGRRPASMPITPSNVSNLRLLGTAPSSGGFAVSDGLVYVSSGEHQVEAYPVSCYAVRASCKPTWVASLGNAGSPMLEAGGGHVYVLSDTGVIHAFSASCGTAGATCRPTWVGAIPGRSIPGLPEIGRDTIYVPGPHRLYAFPASCSSRCQPAWVSSGLPPVPRGGWKYMVISGDTVVLSIDGVRQNMAFPAHCATDGSVCSPSGVWKVPDVLGPEVVADGEMFISSEHRLWVYPRSCAVGHGCQPLWSSPFGGSLVAADNKVFVFSSGTVRAIPTRCDAPPCQPLWEAHGLPWPSPAGGAFLAANGLIFIADHTAPRNCPPCGGIYAFPTACGSGDAECNPVWTWGTAEHVAMGYDLTVTDSRVFASANAGLTVFGIDPSDGARLGTGLDGANQTGTLAFYVAAALAVLLALVVFVRRRRVRL